MKSVRRSTSYRPNDIRYGGERNDAEYEYEYDDDDYRHDDEYDENALPVGPAQPNSHIVHQNNHNDDDNHNDYDNHHYRQQQHHHKTQQHHQHHHPKKNNSHRNHHHRRALLLRHNLRTLPSSINLSCLLPILGATFVLSIVVALTGIVLLASSDSSSTDPINHYCGYTFHDALQNCHQPCPTGRDSECIDDHGLTGMQCFADTNCHNSLVPVQSDMQITLFGSEQLNRTMGENDAMTFESVVLQYLMPYLRENTIDARRVRIVGQELLALSGNDKMRERQRVRRMQGQMRRPMGGSSFDGEEEDGSGRRWSDQEEDDGGGISELSSFGDDSSEGEHRRRRDRRRSRQRKMQTSSSALDVTVIITGEYRPPPFQDMDHLVQDSLNVDDGTALVTELKNAAPPPNLGGGNGNDGGNGGGGGFFSAIETVAAVAVDEITLSPTLSPTVQPSDVPSVLPSNVPSGQPSVVASSSPSLMPSRSMQQELSSAGYGGSTQAEELLDYSGSSAYTTGSYGSLFNLRTKLDGPTILITSIDFYTDVTSEVEYEVWTKDGTYEGHKGSFDDWTLIASGSVIGAGSGQFTSIPPQDFTPVPILGLGATRAFYVTLHSIDILYYKGTGSTSDEVVQSSTPELELYEGQGVLTYPFTANPYLYRSPRNFIGTVKYDRWPCWPHDEYVWPCPSDSPSLSGSPSVEFPPTGMPTARPTTRMPTMVPTMKPTVVPTRAPIGPPPPTTAVSNPTSTAQPTNAPTAEEDDDDEDRLTFYMVLTLNGVPDRIMNRNEEDSFAQTFVDYVQPELIQSGVVVDQAYVLIQNVVLLGGGDGDDRGRRRRRTWTKGEGAEEIQQRRSIEYKGEEEGGGGGVDMEEESPSSSSRALPGRRTDSPSSLELILKVQMGQSALPTVVLKDVLDYLVTGNDDAFINHLRNHRNRDEDEDEEDATSYLDDVSGIQLHFTNEEEVEGESSPWEGATASSSSSSNKKGYEDGANEEGASLGAWTITLIAIGVFWGFLTLCSCAIVVQRVVRRKNQPRQFSSSTMAADETMMMYEPEPYPHQEGSLMVDSPRDCSSSSSTRRIFRGVSVLDGLRDAPQQREDRVDEHGFVVKSRADDHNDGNGGGVRGSKRNLVCFPDEASTASLSSSSATSTISSYEKGRSKQGGSSNESYGSGGSRTNHDENATYHGADPREGAHSPNHSSHRDDETYDDCNEDAHYHPKDDMTLVKNEPEALIGRRLSVRFSGGTFYPGVVASYNHFVQKHVVQFDDGDMKEYTLKKKTIRWGDDEEEDVSLMSVNSGLAETDGWRSAAAAPDPTPSASDSALQAAAAVAERDAIREIMNDDSFSLLEKRQLIKELKKDVSRRSII